MDKSEILEGWAGYFEAEPGFRRLGRVFEAEPGFRRLDRVFRGEILPGAQKSGQIFDSCPGSGTMQGVLDWIRAGLSEDRGHTEDGYGWSGGMAWRGDRWRWCKEEAGGGCGGRNGMERGFCWLLQDFEEEGVAGEENGWRHWKEEQELGGGAHQGQSGWSKNTGATDLQSFKEAPDLEARIFNIIKGNFRGLCLHNDTKLANNYRYKLENHKASADRIQTQSNRLIGKGSAGVWLWNGEMKAGEYHSLRKKQSTSSHKTIGRFSGWATDGPPGNQPPSEEHMPTKLLEKFQNLQGYRWYWFKDRLLLFSLHKI
ncbi:hypothetical protein PPACK8108_LOCUS13769 [Phakopsora pachyrhizi]|uniref:Uncharacterized protein n=1 Tax=Phakopsora pachyrhizi TaxID=170000 RepID=A0AAV0B592_PHAPC|nr:hypothetical protein PPACK8108_LOCUS13769 [Phakopsora pachyrhizi]